MLLDLGQLELETAHAQYSSKFAPLAFQTFVEIWCSIFDAPDEKALQCVLKVREMGFRVGICSNTNRYHWEHVIARRPEYNEASILKFLSYEMKSIKTDKGFFQRIALTTQEPLENHLLIDDLEENISAARQNGLQALRVFKPVEFEDLVSVIKE
jgi:FMN phosphatase YigB (HAD superfamily)